MWLRLLQVLAHNPKNDTDETRQAAEGQQERTLSSDSKIDFLHGSTSASLVSVAEHGLQPPFAGDNNVPFSGELGLGVVPGGINERCVSAVVPEGLTTAVDYCRDFTGWNPHVSQRRLQDVLEPFQNGDLNLHDELKPLVTVSQQIPRDCKLDRKILEPFLRAVDESKNLPFFRLGAAMLSGAIKLELQRQDEWTRLSESQRDNIRSPFPVLYGIQHSGKIYEVRSDINTEVGLPAIEASSLVVFVAPQHIKKAEQLIAQAGSSIPVLDIRNVEQNIGAEHQKRASSGRARLVDPDSPSARFLHHLKKSERALLAQSDIPEARAKAFKSLEPYDTPRGAAEQIVRPALKDKSPKVQLAALKWFQRHGEQIEDFKALKEYSGETRKLRNAAFKAIFEVRARIAAEMGWSKET